MPSPIALTWIERVGKYRARRAYPTFAENGEVSVILEISLS